jgi:hypothetical protein
MSVQDILTGGSKLTAELARQHGKPWLHLSRATSHADAGERLARFVSAHRIRVLNVAGPRASSEPAIGAFVAETLDRALSESSAG